MDEENKFQSAQQQVNTLYQAAQSALLPARDHQVILESARSLAEFLQQVEKDCNKDCGTNIAMPDQQKEG
tara:strand:+ start:406 stop:615 length:210 start_codon:yes stop_codon:yes gene_type:complete